MPRYSLVPFALVLIASFSVRAEDNSSGGFQGELSVCAKRDENKKAAEDTLKDEKVSNGCRQQIKKAIEECFNNPQKLSFSDLAATQGGMNGINGNAAKAAQIYLDGQGRYSQFAQICADQFDKVQKLCQENSDGLKSALHNNGEAWNKSQSDLLSMTGTDPRRPEVLQQIQNESQTKLDLQAQMNKTGDASAAAAKALRDEAVCYSNQAQLYAQAAVKTGEVQAAADIGDDKNELSGATDEAKKTDALYSEGLQDKAKETAYAKTSEKVAEKVGESASETAGKVAGSVGKAGGGVFPAVSLANNDGLGAATGAASTLGDFTLSPTSALRFSGAMMATNLILQPTNLGHCDTPVNYLDPVTAYNANCPVTSVTGKSANESAIAALSSP